MMYKMRLAVTAIVLAALGTSAHAQLVVPPPELNPGDPYRLIFVTTTTIVPVASTSDTTYMYNDFVTADAQGNATLWTLTEEWKAVGSTVFMNARDNTSTNPSELVQVPIYNTRGERIANDYVDLWDASIDNPVTYDRDGNVPSGSLAVYTGTLSNGTGEPALTLGATGAVRCGIRTYSDHWWIQSGEAYGQPFPAQRMYAMSGIIPEPATLTLILLGGLTLLRHRRPVR